ncbi:MAG: YiiX/YebB-like N1pC/P60 family cysteine hydrolase [Gammaproteobacteria bacterium]|nr:YiiX/YebB-like N1pC/P60 family cysteine hydrolase [Gammaproteobacteria bacterium]
MRSEPDIFPVESLAAPRLLEPDDRDRARALWAAFADRMLALEPGEASAFAVDRAAFLARYRFAMDFIEIANRDPGLDQLFNESIPGLGLPAGSYARLKLHYLHVARATEFAALELLHRTRGSTIPEALEAGAKADAERILEMGRGGGLKMTAENAVKVVADTARAATLPAQEGVARWAGNIRVRRHGEALISTAQALELTATLRPGDVLLQRREWYLTNAGIPGFWTHAALYIGSEVERTDFFDDPDVLGWVEGQGHESFEALLRARHSDAYAASRMLDAGNTPRVLEAIAEGVVFTSIEHSAAADSMAVLRPRLSKQERAAAVLGAFGYAGRPYDYDFDFGTDRALVCSELIYKSYQPSADTRGLELPLEVVTGRLMMTPNDMARHFAGNRLDGSRPFDFVTMLDGNERTDSAHPVDVEVFADSWHRPKWHIVIKP